MTKPVALPDLLATLYRVVPAPDAPSSVPAPRKGFDESNALARAGGDPALLKELVGVFLTEAPAWLAELERAAAAGDEIAVRRVAHTLKGAVDTCGIRGGFDAAYELEMLGKDGAFDVHEAGRKAAELRSIIEAALPTMRHMAEEPS